MANFVVYFLQRAIGWLASSRRQRRFVLVIPSAASGSVGDQAMIDSVCAILIQKFGLNVCILDEYPNAAPCDTRAQARVAPFRGRRLRRYFNALFEISLSDACVMIGADVIDGAYNPLAIRRKLYFLKFAAAGRKRSIIFGSSCSESPKQDILRDIDRTQEITLLARDPISQKRFQSMISREIPLVADVAFLLEPELRAETAVAAAAWARARRAAGCTVLAVNAGGHTLASMGEDGMTAYVDVLRSWLFASSDRAILLIPHDSRPAPAGDVEAIESIYDGLIDLGPDRVHSLRFPFDAWDVKALVGGVDLVLTGKMHLAIASLGMERPVAGLVYQGKFEGLMHHFGLENAGLLMEPQAFLDRGQALAFLERFTANAPALRQHIAARLPDILALARKNFDLFAPVRVNPDFPDDNRFQVCRSLIM